MGSVKLGAWRAVHEYLQVKPDNRVVILTDRKSSSFSKAIYNEARRQTEDVNLFVMEDYCTSRRRKFPREIRDTFEDPDKKTISFYLSGMYESFGNRYELLRFGDPITDFIDKKQPTHLKHVCLPGVTKKIIQQGLCVPRDLVKRGTDKIYRRIRKAKKVEIYSPKGTELELKLNIGDIGWRKEDHIDFGTWENLPFGELYTSPIDCNGTFVVDCLIGGYEDYSIGFLKRYPIRFDIKKGKIMDFSCRRSTRLIRELEDELFHTDEQADSVGELGFGTNFGLRNLIGNVLQDEKFPGVHLGIGSSDPYCGKEWDSDMHTDMMMLKPTVFIDGKKLIVDGKYVLRNGEGLGN